MAKGAANEQNLLRLWSLSPLPHFLSSTPSFVFPSATVTAAPPYGAPVSTGYSGLASSVASDAVQGPTSTARRGLSFQQRLTCLLWIVILFDPQFLLAYFHVSIALRIPLVLTVVLAIVLAMKPTKGDWLTGSLAWLILMAIDLPFAYNRGFAIEPLRTMILFYLIGLSVVRCFRTPRLTGFALFTLCVAQYMWWGVMGIKDGMVPWHPNLSNFDGYGPLMACGLGPAYYYAMATRGRTHRALALLTAALSVIGVVSAFARGSVLALIVTAAYIWFRSPNKGRTTVLTVFALVLVLVSSSMIDGTTRGEDTKPNFFEEMSTMFDHSEGSTGDDRAKLWTAATIVFKAHPILGVGASNFGPAAVTLITPGEIPGAMFSDNPNMLYGRALHSNYFEILSEFGLVGVGIYLFLIAQFWCRSRYVLRHCDRINLSSVGIRDVRSLALGLESGMVAYLVSGIFFNQLFTSWFFCIVFANALLYSIASRGFLPNDNRAAPTRRIS